MASTRQNQAKQSNGGNIMKKLISVITAAAMSMVFATSVLAAEWHPSRTQTGATLAQNGATLTTSSGETLQLDSASGSIRITNVADTLSGSSSLDAATNQKTNVVYRAAQASQSTSTLLSKFGNAEEVKTAVADQIAANKAATVSKLNAKKDELAANVENLKSNGASEEEIAAAEQELAKVEAQIAATESADYDSMDNYEPAAIFDVSVDDTVAQQLADGGSVEIPVTVDGITEDSDVLALHFVGDLSDADAVEDALQNDPNATIDEMSVEVLPCVAGDGMVTLTMTSFSPVMILTRAQTEVTVQAPAEQTPSETEEVTATPAPAETVEETETTGSSLWMYIVIVIIVVVIVGAVVVTRKKKTVTAGKK